MKKAMSLAPKDDVPFTRGVEVEPQDLLRLDAVHALLFDLNDSRAAADILAKHVRNIPVLEARIRHEFKKRHERMGPMGIAEQITRLGNRELEALLLTLLEDLTVLSAELGLPSDRDERASMHQELAQPEREGHRARR